MSNSISTCYVLLTIMLTSLLAACRTDRPAGNSYADGPFRIGLEERGDSLHMLFLNVDGEVCDSMLLPYPVYRFDCGDLTGDGVPEICVGVLKSTRYWPEGRRLFIYHIFHRRYIRPLWLGSRVGRPLVDFSVCRDSVPACIHTVEDGADSTVVRCEYRLLGFGLQFRKYLSESPCKEQDN